MRIGLVLSGGIAKGAYQLGVLKVFAQRLPKDFFSCISASSVGILNAYAYATGQLEKAEKTWCTLEFSGLFGFVRSFTRGSYTERLLQQYSFDTPLQQPFYIVCLSLPQMRLNYVDLSPLSAQQQCQYIRAGVAVPPFCTPVEVDGVKYIDGAMVDNIPVQPLCKERFDLVVVIYFDDEDYLFESDEFDSRVIRVSFLEKHVIRDSFAFDIDSVDAMIREGERKANAIVDEYFANGFDSVSELLQQKNCEQKNQRKPRISGDVIVNNINLYAKKLIQYRYLDSTADQQYHRKDAIK